MEERVRVRRQVPVSAAAAVTGDVHLLDDLDELLARYVAFPSAHALTAVVLWVVHCHALEAFESTPRLALLSPEKGSGKTRTLEVLGPLVPAPMHAVNMSAAALYRVVADRQPTLLLDEADTYLGITIAKQHEELRGLINAGHRRGATVYRGEVAGKSGQRRRVPRIRRVRARRHRRPARHDPRPRRDRRDEAPSAARARRAVPRTARPARRRRTPRAARRMGRRARRRAPRRSGPRCRAGIIDRAADVWEPLLAVADLAGGHWPDRPETPPSRINAARAERDPSLGVQLLADCRRIFAERRRRPAHNRGARRSAHRPRRITLGRPTRQAPRRPRPRHTAPQVRRPARRPPLRRRHPSAATGSEDFHDAWQRYLPPNRQRLLRLLRTPSTRERQPTTSRLNRREGGLPPPQPPRTLSLPPQGTETSETPETQPRPPNHQSSRAIC